MLSRFFGVYILSVRKFRICLGYIVYGTSHHATFLGIPANHFFLQINDLKAKQYYLSYYEPRFTFSSWFHQCLTDIVPYASPFHLLFTNKIGKST